jgi:hypothetical protein
MINLAILSATVSAMTTSEIETKNLIDLDNVNQDRLDEVNALVNTPTAKALINHSFESLIKNIKEEEISLLETYAVSTGGNSRVLMDGFSSGFQGSQQGGASVTRSAGSGNGGHCHGDCHGDCHGNHSSRGWR